jgi:hypothetical protein
MHCAYENFISASEFFDLEFNSYSCYQHCETCHQDTPAREMKKAIIECTSFVDLGYIPVPVNDLLANIQFGLEFHTVKNKCTICQSETVNVVNIHPTEFLVVDVRAYNGEFNPSFDLEGINYSFFGGIEHTPSPPHYATIFLDEVV